MQPKVERDLNALRSTDRELAIYLDSPLRQRVGEMIKDLEAVRGRAQALQAEQTNRPVSSVDLSHSKRWDRVLAGIKHLGLATLWLVPATGIGGLASHALGGSVSLTGAVKAVAKILTFGWDNFYFGVGPVISGLPLVGEAAMIFIGLRRILRGLRLFQEGFGRHYADKIKQENENLRPPWAKA